ncbi:hypothetical protein HY797_03215 [Candidatus Falkowbacteria bacterium]|nr:hypothetical protein [Candidatus Falkowbacteria bacterium]
MTEMITSEQEKQIVRFTEDAANKAAKEVLVSLSSLDKETTQKTVIEKGHELQAALVPVISAKLSEFLAEKAESFEVMKASILIRTSGSNPYFDQQFDYWMEFWRKKVGIKNPNFIGIAPFTEHPGYKPLILPKNDLITPQRLYDLCRERFNCWKWYDDSLDSVVIKNDRDPRAGAYVVWFRDQVEADEELKNFSAVKLKEMNIPGITLLEREVMECDHFNRTCGHLDMCRASTGATAGCASTGVFRGLRLTACAPVSSLPFSSFL